MKDILKSAHQALRNQELMKAEKLYQAILADEPNHFDGLHHYALCLAMQDKFQDSKIYFKKAYALNDQAPAMLANYSLLLQKIGEDTAALTINKHLEAVYKKQNTPPPAEIYYNRALILRKMRQYNLALEVIAKGLQINPNHIDLLTEQALQTGYNRDFKESNALFEKLRLKYKHNPDYAKIAALHAVICDKFGFYKKGLKLYQASLNLNPDQALTRFNYSLMQILCGMNQLGWKNYEARWHSVAIKSDSAIIEIRKQLPFPEWDGVADLRSKKLLIYTEQGLGDILHFLRFLPYIKALGGTIYLMLRKGNKSLRPLLENQLGIDEIVDVDHPFKICDYHCGILSLYLYLRDRFGEMPPPFKMRIPKYYQEKWSEITNSLSPQKTKIGIVMQGSGNIAARDTKFEDWQPVFALHPHYDFLLLQKEIDLKLKQTLKTHQYIYDFSNHIEDFADTAALIDQCDRIISIDSAVAHLAGTQKKPLELLLPHFPSFRWGLRHEKTTWYPTARLWRQVKQGKWSHVFNKLAQELMGS